MRCLFDRLCHGKFGYVWIGLGCRFFRIVNFWRPHFGTLDIHVTDHCNLNCKGCSLLSPLARGWFCNVEQIREDLLELSKKIAIFRFQLIGGEPLLHPEITKLVCVVKEAYPKSRVIIVTNGSLLPKMGDDFWEFCRNNRVSFTLSVYPPLQIHLNEYLKLAKDNDIYVRSAYHKTWYKLRFSFKIKGDVKDIHYRLCEQKICHKLLDSKLYLCPLFSLKHYNRYFNESHPTVKGYDIYEYSGKELVKFMKRPDPACRYCTWVMKRETTQWDYSKREKSEWCEDV